MKTALVTGGAGFIGSNLVDRLINDNYKVIVIDDESAEANSKFHYNSKAEYHKVTIENYDLIEPLFKGVDYVFHLAAIARIQPSFKTPIETFNTNVNGTLNVLEYARKNGNVPVVYAGSSSSHGDIYANPYTFTKWNGEELCKLYSNVYNLPTTICRFYNVYGDHQLTEGAYCTVLGVFERLHKENKPLTITSDGEQRRDFTYVGDIVDGLIKSYENSSNEIHQEYELGNGKNYSINELVDAFGDYPREYIPERPGEVRESLNTDTKARDILGWKPNGDIIEYIKENYILEK